MAKQAKNFKKMGTFKQSVVRILAGLKV